jgi:hypothetical protein
MNLTKNLTSFTKSCFLSIVELHALTNATKISIWWKKLANTFILQHSPSRVAASSQNMDQKWAAIFLFFIASVCSWTQDLLAPITYRIAWSSHLSKRPIWCKRQGYIYTSTSIILWTLGVCEASTSILSSNIYFSNRRSGEWPNSPRKGGKGISEK